MNKLFYYYETEKINGEETYEGWLSSRSLYHYGEPDKSEVINKLITDFNVLYNSDQRLLNAHRDKTLFKNRPVIRYHNYQDCSITVSEKNFVEYSLTTEVKEITHRMTMEELMHELSAEEFALWCKDHGLSVCPMNK